MQLYFIRHAQSFNNALWQQTGSEDGRHADPVITDLGQQQTQALVKLLTHNDPAAPVDERDTHNRRGFGLTHIYTSLMTRAVATATLLADALDVPLHAWPDLHEGGGLYLADAATNELQGQAGPNRDYFEQHFPHLSLPEVLSEAGWWNRPFEAKEERLPRAQRVVETLLERHGHTNDHVALVSHGGFYNYVLMALLGMPEHAGFWFVLNNVAITRLDLFAGHVDVVYMNRADHLPPELIT
jgi:2,3-bisphosphoglycerate-dependent phosphoglycerate mutase